MTDDNRYRGSPEFWKLHETIAMDAAWQGRFIESEQFKELPLLPLTAFVVRCAVRARNILRSCWKGSREDETCIDELIEFVTCLSCGESGLTMVDVSTEADQKYRACGKVSEQIATTDIVASECLEAIYDAGRVAARVAGHLAPLSTQYDPYIIAHSCYGHVATAAFAQACNRRSDVHRGMEADFEILKYAFEQQKWTSVIPVDREFFAWHAEFDILKRFSFGNIREMAQGWNASFNDRYVHFPREFFQMSADERFSFFTTILRPFGFTIDLILTCESGRAYLLGLSHTEHGIKELLFLTRHAPGGNEALIAVNRLHGLVPGSGNVLRFSTAFLMTRPADYSLRVAPALLNNFEIRTGNLHSWIAWLLKHEDSDLKRIDPI